MKYSYWARAFLTFILLFIVYTKIDLLDLMSRFSLVSSLDFSICCGLYLVGQFLSAYKWNLLLRGSGIVSKLSDILRAYFLGMFINSFGLGTVGGDVARGFSLICENGKRGAVLATVIADRIHGLSILLSIGLVSLVIVAPPYLPTFAFNIASLVLLIFVIGWFLGPFILIKILPLWVPKRDKIIYALNAFPKDFRLLSKISIVSICFHSIQIYLAYFIFHILSRKIEIGTAFTTIPFVNVASALPISINGLGVREAVSVYMLSPSGIDGETAVAFSAIWVIIVTLVSGVCGLFVIPKLGEGVGSFLNRIKDKETTYGE